MYYHNDNEMRETRGESIASAEIFQLINWNDFVL